MRTVGPEEGQWFSPFLVVGLSRDTVLEELVTPWKEAHFPRLSCSYVVVWKATL